MQIALSFPSCHRRGGVERILVECANFLAARGHSVRVLSAQFDPGVLAENIRPQRIDTGPLPGVFRLNSYIRNVHRQLAAEPPDVYATFGAVCPPGGVSWVQSVHAAWLE